MEGRGLGRCVRRWRDGGVAMRIIKVGFIGKPIFQPRG